jgi:hypothetical protein
MNALQLAAPRNEPVRSLGHFKAAHSVEWMCKVFRRTRRRRKRACFGAGFGSRGVRCRT